MGIDRTGISIILAAVSLQHPGQRGVLICELGNQRVTKSTLSVLLEHGYEPDVHDLWSVLQGMVVTPSPALASGKKVFEALGIRHVSLDINGRDGAVLLDLSRPLNSSLHYLLGKCDVVTNFGTTEHIGESEYIDEPEGYERLDIWHAQYNAFRNIHGLARSDGGMIINMVPAAGCWPRHGAVEYEPRFFHTLAGAAGYEIRNLSLHRPDHDWSAEEAHLFWRLLREALRRQSYSLPDDMNADKIPALQNYAKEEQANVLSVFVRRGLHAFPDQQAFLQSPGLHLKRKAQEAADAEKHEFCLDSPRMRAPHCFWEMAETGACEVLHSIPLR
ncbi:unnamed protein product [Symbiodinium microadriaticum]|nr:unnamed protein product [Symbiodinium microadriaticum]